VTSLKLALLNAWQEIIYNFRAEIYGTGNRSEVSLIALDHNYYFSEGYVSDVCHRHQCMDHVMTVESGYSVKSGALRPQQKIIIIIINCMSRTGIETSCLSPKFLYVYVITKVFSRRQQCHCVYLQNCTRALNSEMEQTGLCRMIQNFTTFAFSQNVNSNTSTMSNLR